MQMHSRALQKRGVVGLAGQRACGPRLRARRGVLAAASSGSRRRVDVEVEEDVASAWDILGEGLDSVTKFVESLRKEGAPSSSSVAGEGRGDGDIIDTVATYIEEKIAENPRRLPEDDNVSKVKPPPGVSIPSQQPNFSNRRVGFTFKAERINSRYAMVGFVAVLLIEAATGRGVLEILGFNIGNGLDLWF